jgi:hypothetical protein
VIEVLKGSARARRHALPGIAALCFACAAAALPATASASAATCGGATKKVVGAAAQPNELEYTIKCDSNITAYSIIVGSEVDSFGTETSITPVPGGADGKIFGCEGSIPANGFGCSKGLLPPGATLKGTFATAKSTCANPKKPVSIWMTAVDDTGSATEPFTLASPKCPKPKPKKKGSKPKKTVRHGHR